MLLKNKIWSTPISPADQLRAGEIIISDDRLSGADIELAGLLPGTFRAHLYLDNEGRIYLTNLGQDKITTQYLLASNTQVEISPQVKYILQANRAFHIVFTGNPVHNIYPHVQCIVDVSSRTLNIARFLWFRLRIDEQID